MEIEQEIVWVANRIKENENKNKRQLKNDEGQMKIQFSEITGIVLNF